MNWIEDVFLSDLESKVKVFNKILKLPENVILEPIAKCQRVDEKFINGLLHYYSTIFDKHLSQVPVKSLKNMIDLIVDLVDPNIIITESSTQMLSKVFRLFFIKQFIHFFSHKTLRHKFDSFNSSQLQVIISQIEASTSQTIKKIHYLFKSIMEDKIIDAKITNLSLIRNKFKFDLVSPSAGTLCYESLPPDLQERFKTVMTRFEFEFFKKFLDNPKIQLLIETGYEKLAPSFAEKIQKILRQEATSLVEIERKELIDKLMALFVKDSKLDDSVEFLADNIQQCEVDGRIILSQVFDCLTKQKKMADISDTLKTILIDSGLSQMEDLPNFNLTGPECMFVLAMDFIESCNDKPSTVSVNILGKQ